MKSLKGPLTFCKVLHQEKMCCLHNFLWLSYESGLLAFALSKLSFALLFHLDIGAAVFQTSSKRGYNVGTFHVSI